MERIYSVPYTSYNCCDMDGVYGKVCIFVVFIAITSTLLQEVLTNVATEVFALELDFASFGE